MPLIGTLSTMSLPDLLQWLGTARHTGTLEIERNKVVKRILFKDGQVIGCSSEDPPERIGHFLLSRGKITEEHLREALRRQEVSRRHLGSILVELGCISEADVTSHLAAKSEETIYSIFDWDDAVFRFEEKLTDVQNVLPVSLRVEDILLRGLKRYDEMRLIRELLNDPGIQLRRTERTPPPEVLRNKMARRVYESIDGERTVGEILLISHGSEYLVNKFLYELHRNRYIEIASRRKGEREPVPGPAPAVDRTDAAGPTASRAASASPRPQPLAQGGTAVAEGASLHAQRREFEARLGAVHDLMCRGEYDAALQVLDALYREHPEDPSLRRLVHEAEAAFVEKAYRHYVPGSRVPVLTCPIEALESEKLSPTEFYLLSRIDGTWDVKSIIQIAPLREVEALRTLKRMREKGLITFRD
jgi:hypothetical protein